MVNKYNILFTLNSSYFTYGKIFINSMYDKNDMSKVNKIYLADTGLNDEDRKFFVKYPHVEILETNVISDFNDGGTWGNGWQKSVLSKTKSLYKLLFETNLPVMMIDADSVIVKDLSELILVDKDIQICCRANENKEIPYLGSFVIAHNNDRTKEFIWKWIKNIDNNPTKRAKESPMLGKTVEEFRGVMYDLVIHDVPRVIVSCHTSQEFNSDVSIIHLKGGSLSDDIEEDHSKRIHGTHGFGDLIERYI